MKKAFLIGLVLAAGLALAGNGLAAGDAKNGKKLFESKDLGGGATGKSCATCHPGGSRLSKSMFGGANDLARVKGMVNSCIEGPLDGAAIDPDGPEMADLLAYMESVTKGSSAKKKFEGC